MDMPVFFTCLTAIDPVPGPLYIGELMNIEKSKPITDADLKSLEHRIDELIRNCQRLKEENRLLLKQQASLVAERAKLKQKNDLARTQTESILTRLKALEA